MASFETFYNTSKHHIVLREYGRTVQEMCDTLLKMENKDQRTKTAHTIIEVMRQVNPTIPNNAPKDNDTENKLWDDLHIICNFELDITDAPFPTPESGKKPVPLTYQRKKIKLRHYGKHLELLVKEATQKTDSEEQYQAYGFILRLMKTYYSGWQVDNNRDNNFVDDIETLAGIEFTEELRERLLIEGGIIDPATLNRLKQRQASQKQNNQNNRNQNNRNHHQNNRNHNNNNKTNKNNNTNGNSNSNSNGNTNNNSQPNNLNNKNNSNNRNRNNKNRFRKPNK
jgi:hypothetical protein